MIATSRVRMTVDLSAGLNAVLERYMAKHHVTKAEALRIGVDGLLRAKKAKDDGFTVGAWVERRAPCCGRMVRHEREFDLGL